MEEKLSQLKDLLHPSHDLSQAAALLAWDQETYMPPGGAAARAEQLATLSRLSHELFTADEVGVLLDDLAPYEADLDEESDAASLIRVTRREYQRARRVPAELVAEIAHATSLAQQAWVKARQESDFPAFQPYLEKNVDLRVQWAACFDVAPGGHSYDPLLDVYEPGMTTGQVQAVFQALRPALVDQTAQIAERQDAVDDSFLHQPFSEAAQWDFSLEMARGLGYDFERGRQDRSAHPFTISFSIDDVRITSRIDPAFPSACWFATIHETGHALYEQGIDKALARTPLASAASMGVHESQSRLYENIVARGKPFWTFYYPRAQERFPSQLGNVPLDDFHKAINKSQPSLIRVEADEVTYGLHIILRFELEQAMIDGAVKIADLPELWNTRMQEYLGLTPPDDAQGVLQDVHWAAALIGYFPTYLLGSVLAVQLYEQAQADLPALDESFAQGDFAPLLEWLREHVHRHGCKFTLPELTDRICGGPLAIEPYVRYLRAKFGDIYDL